MHTFEEFGSSQCFGIPRLSFYKCEKKYTIVLAQQ